MEAKVPQGKTLFVIKDRSENVCCVVKENEGEMRSTITLPKSHAIVPWNADAMNSPSPTRGTPVSLSVFYPALGYCDTEKFYARNSLRLLCLLTSGYTGLILSNRMLQ
ncbi:hypothetical protein CBL_00647 [Carabus blaptoides fortunei]